MDHLTTKERSINMSKIKGKDTKPEILVRKIIYSLGYRYRLHGKDLPGKPDIFFIGKKKTIFINGCFWHRHKNCKYATKPKTNSKYWITKFRQNVKRDKQNYNYLDSLGWCNLIIWSCELRDITKLKLKIEVFLKD